MSKEKDGKQPGFFNHLVGRFSDLWNLPNEVIGQGLGYAGYGIGQVTSRLGYGERPRIEYDPVRGMTNFINSPLTPIGALTIGHTTMYNADPDGPEWAGYEPTYGHSVRDHEAAHAPQARLLGPLYLPSNLLGGIASLMSPPEPNRSPWHRSANWNEVGPYMNPPRPWPRSDVQ